jgi:hypothetical protein
VRKPTDLFSTKALDVIADYSMGLPPIALKIATACLNELIIQNLEKTTASVVNSVVNQMGFQNAVALIESMDKDEEEDPITILTPKRRDIITAILGHQIREHFFFPATGVDGLRSSDLAEFFGVNLSTMNYHIKPLTQTTPLPILEAKDDVHDARSKIFCVNWDSPIATAVEILTVQYKLRQERFNVKDQSILIQRRETA